MQTNTMGFTVLGKISLFSAQWIYSPIESHTKEQLIAQFYSYRIHSTLIPNIHTWWTLFFHPFKQSHIFYVSQNVFYWSIHKSFIENLFCQKIYSNDLNSKMSMLRFTTALNMSIQFKALRRHHFLCLIRTRNVVFVMR